MSGESKTSSTSLLLELQPENSQAIGLRLLMFFLGTFFVVFPVAGLTIYVLIVSNAIESDYSMYVAIAIPLLFFCLIIQLIIENTKTVYQVDTSDTGFNMFTTQISSFQTPVNGWYKWEDIAYYTYEPGGENTKLTLSLYLNTGQCLTFYYLGFKEYGDLPKFYHILCQHLPGKERKM